MKVINNPQVYMEPGTYYIGDLCYVLNDSWDEFCKLTINEHDVLDGGFRFKDGREFVTFTTMYGDGTYQDKDGFNYPVDAGLIGCIRVEDMDADIDSATCDGRVHVFTKPFICEKIDGTIYFGKIAIDTSDDPFYNEDEEEEDY